MKPLRPSQLPDEDEPAVLDYASPGIGQPTGDVSVGGQVTRIVVGCFTGVVLTIAGLVIGLFTAIAIGQAVKQVASSNLVVIAVAAGFLVLLVQTVRQNWSRKAFLLGMLIGGGLVFLAVGLCFANFRI